MSNIEAAAKEIATAIAEAEYENNSVKICLWNELVEEILAKHFPALPPAPVALPTQQPSLYEADEKCFEGLFEPVPPLAKAGKGESGEPLPLPTEFRQLDHNRNYIVDAIQAGKCICFNGVFDDGMNKYEEIKKLRTEIADLRSKLSACQRGHAALVEQLASERQPKD